LPAYCSRHHWVAYVGLAVVLYVAVEMIYRGAMEVYSLASG
jgi:predicted tellurium resistance membrane protein TerC